MRLSLRSFFFFFFHQGRDTRRITFISRSTQQIVIPSDYRSLFLFFRLHRRRFRNVRVTTPAKPFRHSFTIHWKHHDDTNKFGARRGEERGGSVRDTPVTL